MVKLKGSTVIEMTYLMPVVLLCWILIIFTFFYYHDKNIIGGAAYETAVVGSEQWRWQKKLEEGKMEEYFQNTIKRKLLFFDRVSVTITPTDDEICVEASARKKRMSVAVRRSAAIGVPEERVRAREILREMLEKNTERNTQE